MACNLDSGDSTPSLVDPDLLTSEPVLSMLRTHYCVAMSGSVAALVKAYDSGEQLSGVSDKRLCMPRHNIKSLKCLELSLVLTECFSQLAILTSHKDVIKTIQLADVIVQTCRMSTELDSCTYDWTSALRR